MLIKVLLPEMTFGFVKDYGSWLNSFDISGDELYFVAGASE